MGLSPPPSRKLGDQLGAWSPDQLAALLQRRPDLVQPSPPADLAGLADRAQTRPSVEAAIAAVTLPENRLLQLVVCCRPAVPVDELAAALPEGVSPDDVEATLSKLEAAALVWRHRGRIHTSAALRQAMPTVLGPPLAELVKDQAIDYLRSVVITLRTALDDHGFAGDLPARASGGDGPSPRGQLIEELQSLLAAPGVVDAVLAGGPDECVGIAGAMAEGPPVTALDHPLYFARSLPNHYREHPTYWLFAHGLLFPLGHDDLGVQPREVGVALRGGRPVPDLALHPPRLVAGEVEVAEIDALAATKALLTLDRLADLLDRWEVTPAKTLKSGGLGATVMKQTATALDIDVEEATRLVELANLAGLIVTDTVTRKERRSYVQESFVGPGPAAPTWAALDVPQRWHQLATAWLRAEHWPSASGRKGPDGKSIPVLGGQYGATAPGLRRRALDVLATLAPGTATTPGAFADHVYWTCPQPWLRRGSVAPPTAIGWVYAEAALLGVSAGGSLSSFGRALLAGDRRTAENALEAARPEPATTFTLQADLTAIVVGSLERSVAVELRLAADVESTGAATTLRFSDASLRRAMDAGRDGDEILAFLEAHATKGVPASLAYLVSDVWRRYGHLRVGGAASIITSEDPAALADACSHRRTRKLTLRLLAPTVAVSSHPPAKVMDALRDAGFLPTGDGDHHEGAGDEQWQPLSVAAGRGAAPTGPAASGGSRPAARLPERFQARARSRSAPAVDASTATKLAEAILAASPEPGVECSARAGPIADLLEWAYINDRALAIALGDEDDLAEPMLLAITIWEPERIVATDLSDGTLVSILLEHIGSATDLGPLDEIANVALLGSARRSSGRRPQRR